MIEVIRHVKWLLSPLPTLCNKFQMTSRLLVERMIYCYLQEGSFQGLSLKWQNTIPNFTKLAKLSEAWWLNWQASSKKKKKNVNGTKRLKTCTLTYQYPVLRHRLKNNLILILNEKLLLLRKIWENLIYFFFIFNVHISQNDKKRKKYKSIPTHFQHRMD